PFFGPALTGPVGGVTSGAPSPADGSGAGAAGDRCGTGAAAGAAGRGAAGGGGATRGSVVLRFPNTTYALTHPERFSFCSSGDSRPDRAFFTSVRPVSACARWRKISAVLWLDDTSAIIWPLLAAVPKICGSNGMMASG